MVVIIHNNSDPERQVQIEAGIVPRRLDLIALPNHWQGLWLTQSDGDLYCVYRVILRTGETNVLDTAHVYVGD